MAKASQSLKKPISSDLKGLFQPQAVLEAPSLDQKSLSALQEKMLSRVKGCNNPANKDFFSGFRDLPALSLDHKKAIKVAADFRKQFKRLLVLGTGGSSLGSKAVIDCFAKNCDREVFFIEILDTFDLPELKKAELKKTAVVAISKSGSTLETLLSLSYFEEQFSKAGLKIKKHFIAISDADANPAADTKNSLRLWAHNRDVTILDMHPSIGGRWSVSTSVGIFPIAFAGLNAKKFISAFEESFSKTP